MRSWQRHATLVLIVAATLSGCGGPGTPQKTQPQAQTATSQPPDPSSFGEPVGVGCAGIPTDPKNKSSFAAMSELPVSEAIAVNPLLTRFARALKVLPDLQTQLDKATDLTMFVPSDAAFSALGRKPLVALFKNDAKRNALVSYAVVPQRVVPPDLTKPVTFPTAVGPDSVLSVTVNGGVVTLNGAAHIVCSNVLTANATIYILDAVLQP